MILTTVRIYKIIITGVFVVAWQITAIFNCNAQELVAPVNNNEAIFLARIKQFNEFLDRFNYKTDFYGNPINQEFMSKMPRDKMINAMFDLKDKRIDPSSKEYSKEYADLINKFIADIADKDFLIGKYSPNIIAEARSKVVFKGSAQEISIFLAQEDAGNNKIKWVILDVKGQPFDFLKTDTTLIRFIPPASNETDFQNLKRALDDVNYLGYYADKNYTPDYLTLFFYLINTGAMKFDLVSEITYHIIDIPGWSISVKEFNRNDLNSGWLISNLSKNASDRKEYIKGL